MIMMCEVPSNAILADGSSSKFFDGFSIGSNDLTQLTLGLDRDSGLELLAKPTSTSATRPSRRCCSRAIEACKRAQGKYVGICGQGPSDHPGLRAVADGGGHRVDLAEPGHA